MPAFRVYFLEDASIIAADMIEAPNENEAGNTAVHGLASYEWAGKLLPNCLEVWERGALKHAALLA